MALLKFGNTWWGKEWLNAFNNIYDSNRLPRGQRYARNGSVVSMELAAGKVEAKVQGSYPRPYKIKISVPILSKQEQQIVLNIITNNPFYLAQLLAAKLPPALNEDLAKQGVKLFPQNWNDFSGSCSCPDYANPCKHLAAIIYQIANKIDLNPFVVFELKGFDLLQRVSDLYGTSHAIKPKGIPTAPDFNLPAPFETLTPIINAAQCNFVLPGDLSSKVLSLLPRNPLFLLTGDYHATLSKHYRDLAKASLDVFTVSATESEIIPVTYTIEPIQINPDLSYNCKLYNFQQTHLITDLAELLNFIKEIPSLSLNSNSAQLNGLYLIFHLCRTLMYSGAIIPQLYLCESKKYQIRYIPLMADEQVQKLVMQVSALLPTNLCVFGPKKQQLAKVEQCLWLISLFIKHVSEYTQLALNLADNPVSKLLAVKNQRVASKTPKSLENKTDKIDALFLSQPQDLSLATDAEFINQVHLWLSRFNTINSKYKILLQVKEYGADFALELLVKDLANPNDVPLSIKSSLSSQPSAVSEVLYQANLISDYIPDLGSIFTSEKPCHYSEEEFLPLFFDILPVLKLIGVEVLLPKSLKNLVLPKLALRVESNDNSTTSYLKLDEILEFDWQISLGNTSVSVAEFNELLVKGNKLVKLKDSYVYLDQKLIDNILSSLNKPIKTATGAGLLRDLLAGDSDNAIPFVLSENVKQLINQLLAQETTEQPNNLLATLRDYQYQGYCWLYKNVRLGFGSVIADDMGLGKTLQVISCILKLKQDKLIKNSLVVVPTSLLTNWAKELQRFAPELTITTYHGKYRSNLNTNDITLITYGTVRRDIEKINKYKWDLLVIDEAQNIKNLSSQQTKLVKSIKSKYRIAMSGTPVENRLLEYYSIMDFANKGYLGGVTHFNKQFARPIESERDIQKLNKFLLATKPFVLRRLKNDKSIIQDLPDKTVIDEYCTLSKAQVALYQATLNSIMEKLKSESDELVRRGLVLTLIMALKQICNHPGQYLKQFNNINIEDSGKLLFLLDKLKDIYANQEKVLIFTQFSEMGTILQEIIEKYCNTPVLFLQGSTTRKKRDEMVELIQNDPQHQTMILSIKAGGVGLNLTSANHVIHYDLWWNPAVENQATDRAYRIGQNKNVFVHRLVCSNSFEEKINQMIRDKQDLANLTVTTGEQWIGNLSDKELKQIFTLNTDFNNESIEE